MASRASTEHDTQHSYCMTAGNMYMVLKQRILMDALHGCTL